MVFQAPSALDRTVCSAVMASSLASMGPVLPGCPHPGAVTVYSLSHQGYAAFPASALVQAGQLHDLHHVDESPWKLWGEGEWASLVPRVLWEGC